MFFLSDRFQTGFGTNDCTEIPRDVTSENKGIFSRDEKRGVTQHPAQGAKNVVSGFWMRVYLPDTSFPCSCQVKMKALITIGFFLCISIVISLAIASYVKRDETARTVTDSLLQFLDEDVKQLEKKKLELEQEKVSLEILRVEDQQSNIPFTRRMRNYGSLAALGTVLVSALIVSWGLYHKYSVHEIRIGKHSTLRVRYKDLGTLGTVQNGLVLSEQLRSDSKTEQKAFEMSLKLSELVTCQLKTLVGRRGLLGLPEPTNQIIDLPLVQPSHEIPSFYEILEDLSEGDEMVLGYDLDTGNEIRGGFDDLYSSFLAGKTRSGKSSWLRGLMLQSIMCYPEVRFYVLDPHRNHPDGLSNSLPKTEHFIFLDPNSPRQGFYQFNRKLQSRLDHPNGEQPLVFVCDELNYCSKQPYANSLQALFGRIATEGAKAKCYLLASSQDTRTKKGLDFRDTLSSCYVFDLKSSQARFLLQDKDECLKHKRIRDLHEKGVCLFVPSEDESQPVKVPYCSPGDVKYLEKKSAGNRYGSIQVTNKKRLGNEGGDNPETDGNSDPVTEGVADSGNATVSEVLPDTTVLAEIDTYMQDHDVSLSKFAEMTGVNKGYLSQCLKGEKKLSSESRMKLEGFISQK